MCGIAGIFNLNNKSVSDKDINQMLDLQEHRGPDGRGNWIEQNVGLGHVRLSILDLSVAGSQPMYNEDRSLILVCNGEIYNYKELREELIQKGHFFTSDSDSEILLHLYEENRDNSTCDFLSNVRGMFSFAIMDRKKWRLIIGRDRIGIKPLFYYHDKNKFIFASELSAFKHLENLSIDWTSIYEYLQYCTIPGPNTIFKQIKHVKPGNIIIIEDNNLIEQSYWSLNPLPKSGFDNKIKVQKAIENCLEEVTRMHLISDVPIGSFLSAGIDSTIVTSYAAKMATKPIHTFCATFPGEEVDEGKDAFITAKKLNTTHHEFILREGFLDELDSIVKYMDQPMGLTSAVSLFQISRTAKENITVILSGDGGDEVWGGYDYRHTPFVIPKKVRWIPQNIRKIIGKSIVYSSKKITPNYKGKLVQLGKVMMVDEVSSYINRLRVMEPANAIELIPKAHRKEIDSQRYTRRIKDLFQKCRKADFLNRQLFVDIHSSLSDEMLFKIDRMTMAWGIEGRVPLLDHKFIELSMEIPGQFKREGAFGKLPLRKIVEDQFGKQLAYRKKTGFSSPLGNWLENDEKTKNLFEEYLKIATNSNLIESSAMKEMNSTILSPVNYFQIIVLGLWSKKFQKK